MSDAGDSYVGEDAGAGWLFFSGTVLGLAGIMRILDGFWALGYDGPVVNLAGGVLGDKLDNYGWLWLGVGVVLLLSSFLVLTRSQLARWVGIIGAAIAAISAMTWMPYYPIWSMTYVLIAVLVMYGLGRWGGRHPSL